MGPAATSRPRGGRVELEERRAGGKEEVECSVALVVCDLRSCRPLKGRVLGAACKGTGGAEAVIAAGEGADTGERASEGGGATACSSSSSLTSLSISERPRRRTDRGRGEVRADTSALDLFLLTEVFGGERQV